MTLIETLQQSGELAQGGFVAAVGLVGVFIVLVLFFFSIKLLQKFERK